MTLKQVFGDENRMIEICMNYEVKIYTFALMNEWKNTF